MKYKVRNFGFQVKEVSDEGEFSGYLSVYNVIDAYRERVAPGAFATTLRKWASLERLPPILWQHRSGEPIGPYTLMREDDRGLYTEGVLLVKEIQRAREARALLKAKAINGMSIGFNSVVEEWHSEDKLLTLKEIDLWEGSIVTFQANLEATVDAVKAVNGGKLPSMKEFEEYLRDAGFSRSQAKTIVGHGYAGLLRDAESQPSTITVADELKSQLNSITKELFL